jgi:hypothetical protein
MTAPASTPLLVPIDDPSGPAEHFTGTQSRGWGRLGSLGTILLYAGVAITLAIIWVTTSIAAAIVFCFTYFVAFMWATVRDHTGQSKLEVFSVRHAWAASQRKGYNQYHAGPNSRVSSWRLPGVLSQSRVTEHRDSTGTPYALTHIPATGDWGVTIAAHPDGASLLSQMDQDNGVTAWGDTLKFLCHEPGCVEAKVVIDSAADPGYGLQKRLLGRITDDAPEVARRVVEELAERTPTGASLVRTWITLTFAGGRTKPPSKLARAVAWFLRRPAPDTVPGKSERRIADMLAARLPVILEKLSTTGAGLCTLSTQQELAHAVRVAYDPASTDGLSMATAEGMPVVMRWDSIGPTTADNGLTYYATSTGVNRTWAMCDIRGSIYDETLAPILEPSKLLARKRVAIIYSLHGPGESAALAQNDVETAAFKVRTSHQPSQRLINQFGSASITAKHEAKGAGVVDVSVLVTCTILSPAMAMVPWEPVNALPDLDAVMASIGPAARMEWRPEDGVQASAFARALPVPFRPQMLVKVPVRLRTSL